MRRKMKSGFMIYGATGYTGKLITQYAKSQGLSPVIAGRNSQKVQALAEKYGFEGRVFSLTDIETVAQAVADVKVVLHCAGPFSATAYPMLQACLKTRTHYLDITGEIDVFEMIHEHHAQLVAQNIMALPGAGFDVVPSDCLAAHVKKRLPDANRLILAIQGLDTPSRGTAKTALENLHTGCRVRRDGKIISLPSGELQTEIDFGNGPRPCVAVGWGDVSTAYYSTGIPNIEVYFRATKMLTQMSRLGRRFGWLLRLKPVQALMKRLVDRQPEGPDEAQLRQSHATLIARAEAPDGRAASSLLITPGGYYLTALSAVAIVQQVLADNFKPGFQTPSLAYGSDFVLTLEGVKREDLP
jgi:short subunit dehydrogenase-like uncharacterized protein